jgi:hypothetical protein
MVELDMVDLPAFRNEWTNGAMPEAGVTGFLPIQSPGRGDVAMNTA